MQTRNPEALVAGIHEMLRADRLLAARLFGGRTVAWLLGSTCGVVSLSAMANLNNVPDMNETQAGTAEMIQRICPTLVTNTPNLSSAEVNLRNRCRDMVQTSNAQQGSGPTTYDLGLTDAGLRDMLQRVAPEEISTFGTQTTDTSEAQTAGVAGRMRALHSGTGRGAGAVSFFLDGIQLPLALSTNATAAGGAAGDQEAVSKQLSWYINGSIDKGDKETTVRESGFDYQNYGVTFGIDKQYADSRFFGAAVDYVQNSADMVNDGGYADSDGYKVSLYSTGYISSKIYLDGLISYGQNNYDSSRRFKGSATVVDSNGVPTGVTPVTDDLTGSTEGEDIAASLTLGKDLDTTSGGVDVGLFLRADYQRSSIDAYQESGTTSLELEYQSQAFESLTSVVGAQIGKAISRPFGILVPQARAEYHHEFMDNSREIWAKYVHYVQENYTLGTAPSGWWAIHTDEPDRDYFTVGIGISTVYQRGMQAFFWYETTLGLEDITANSVTLGIRGEF